MRKLMIKVKPDVTMSRRSLAIRADSIIQMWSATIGDGGDGSYPCDANGCMEVRVFHDKTMLIKVALEEHGFDVLSDEPLTED